MRWQVIYEPSNTCGPKAARLQDKAKEKMAMKTRWPGRTRAQVKAMAEGANRTGFQEGVPQTLREHLDKTCMEVPAALEGNSNEVEEGRNEETSCAFSVITSSLYITHAASSRQRS